MLGYVSLKAPAKINLILDVLDKRDDGYHNIRSVMQTVTVFDYITISTIGTRRRKTLPKIKISCSDSNIPTDERNIVYKVCAAYLEAAGSLPFKEIEIKIYKNIPSCAGLAGGSTDGAAVLKAINSICGDYFSTDDLYKIGASVGADIPFCINGGTSLCEGIGGKITPLTPFPECKLLIVKPRISISTAEAYRKFDELKNPKLSDFDAFKKGLDDGDLAVASRNISNSLEDVINESAIDDLKKDMIESGALGSMMTGSGSAVFGIFPDKKSCDLCAEKYHKTQAFCQVCSPFNKGVHQL